MFSLDIFEETHNKLIDKLLRSSRQYEVAKHEFEIQKKNHNDLVESKKIQEKRCNELKESIQSIENQIEDSIQELKDIVGLLDFTHIPIQIRKYKDTISQAESQYRILQKILLIQFPLLYLMFLLKGQNG